VAEAVGPECKKIVVGIRPGEKIHEEMISSSDSFFTYDLGKYYTIIPQKPIWNLDKYKSTTGAVLVPEGFSYDSETNEFWETIDTLRKQIKEHVDSTFEM
jgi:FlaA1/EpsC-like NDP-sugar epimerase